MLPAAALSGLDGFGPRPFPGPAGLHVLGLLSATLAEELRYAHRSPAAESFAQLAIDRCRCRHLGARPTRRQRPRAHVGAIEAPSHNTRSTMTPCFLPIVTAVEKSINSS